MSANCVSYGAEAYTQREYSRHTHDGKPTNTKVTKDLGDFKTVLKDLKVILNFQTFKETASSFTNVSDQH